MASLLAIILQSLRDLFTSRCTQVSPAMLLYYNYILTLSDEVDLFWNRKWSVGHVLFVLIRYEPLGWSISLLFVYMNTHDSSNVREVYGRYVYIIQAICFASALHAILILRLYGLYGSKKFVYVLSLFLATTIFAEIGVAVKYSPHFFSVSLWQAVGNLCVANYSHKLTYIWLPVIVFEVAVFLLAAYKGVQGWLDGNLQRSRLMQIMVRDSLAYFFIIIALDVVNFVIWLHARESLISVTFMLTGTIMSILGTQMLMNIKREAWLTTDHCSELSAMRTLGVGTLEFRRTGGDTGELAIENLSFVAEP